MLDRNLQKPKILVIRKTFEQRFRELTKSNSVISLLFVELNHFDFYCENFGFAQAEIFLESIYDDMASITQWRDFFWDRDKKIAVLLPPLDGVQNSVMIEKLSKKCVEMETEEGTCVMTFLGSLVYYPENGTALEELQIKAEGLLEEARVQGVVNSIARDMDAGYRTQVYQFDEIAEKLNAIEGKESETTPEESEESSEISQEESSEISQEESSEISQEESFRESFEKKSRKKYLPNQRHLRNFQRV